jgi:iron complex outermembrane receptor protein
MALCRPLPPALLALALALAFALAPCARAEDAPPPAEDDAALPSIGEAVVRGGSRPQSSAALAPGAAVTVVDAQRYAGEAKGAADLLATSPGVSVSEHGGIGSYATVSIRGSSAEEVKVLLDGIPINPSAGGGVDLSSIPSQWISRIEVVRGTEGVHHGSGALGGVVNVVTAAPRGKLWSAGATAGSFETWQADAQAGAGGGSWGLLGSVAASGSSGRFRYRFDDGDVLTSDELVRANNGSLLGGALLKAFVLAGGGRLDAAAQLSGGRRDLPGSRLDPRPDDWQEDARGLVSARFRWPGPSGVAMSAGASARLDRLDLRLEDLGGVVTRQRGVVGTGTLGADWTGAHGSLAAQVEGGAERLAGDGLQEHTRPQGAVALSGRIETLGSRLTVGPGIRLERAGKYGGVSAKLGASLRVFGPLSLRASAGRTYRVPSFAELYLQQGVVGPNPALRPEVGVGGDAALVAQGRYGTASAGAFSTLYRDLVVYQPASFRRFLPQNDAKALMRGIEAELATTPLRRLAGLAAGLAYTFTDSATLRGAAAAIGKDVPRHPRHRLYGRLGVGGAVAEAHGEAQWISRYFFDFENRGAVPDALTVGAGASLLLHRTGSIRLHVDVRNLLDDRSLQDGFENPLPGRMVLVTLRAGSNQRPK